MQSGDESMSDGSAGVAGGGGNQPKDGPQKLPRFRNYRPRDPGLQQYMMERPRVPDVAKEISEKLAQLLASPEDATLNLAPKKRNWDLKRDLAPKLTKLERRTQAAIYDLLRTKLQSEPADDDDGGGGGGGEEEEGGGGDDGHADSGGKKETAGQPQ